jgi:hypothetical protein
MNALDNGNTDTPTVLQREPSNVTILPPSKAKIVIPSGTKLEAITANLTNVLTEIAAAEAAHKAEHGAKYLQAGQLLLRAKGALKATKGHGRWIDYLRDFGLPERRAQNWMRLAKEAAKYETVSYLETMEIDIGLKATLKAIAKPLTRSPAPATSTTPPTRSERKLRAASEAWHDLEPPERKEFMERVGFEAKHTPCSAEHRLAKAEEKIAEMEAELDAAALVEPSHAETTEKAAITNRATAEPPNDAEDLIARQGRQLADLEAAWERANFAVRQTFFRRINAEAPELSDG